MHTIALPEGIITKYFVLADGALKELPELLQTAFPGRRPWIVADENTWKAAGADVMAILEAAGLNPHKPYIFPAHPHLHPNYDLCEMLRDVRPEDALPVSVGSGVINDLVKCSSKLAGTQYCCVPTACSVDGYASSGAALSVKGSKKTVPCPAPYAICGDTKVLANAPAEMLSSGYADLMAKMPGGADWIIADEMGEEAIAPKIWDTIQGPLRGWLKDCKNEFNILTGLNTTGYTMQMYHDSRPASGCEHLFSHIWEMEGLTYNGEDVSHGFKVGVGVLASTLLLEFITKHSFKEVSAWVKPGLTEEGRLAEIDELLKRGCYGPEPKQTAMRKFMTGAKLAERRQFIEAHWENLRERISKQMLPYETLKQMLIDANCPYKPQMIGLSEEQFLHGIHAAQLIRVRYTSIDLLYEAGLLDKAVDGLKVML